MYDQGTKEMAVRDKAWNIDWGQTKRVSEWSLKEFWSTSIDNEELLLFSKQV